MSDGPLKVTSADAYKAGITERTRLAREAKQAAVGGHVPNLVEADAAFDPRRDAPRTLGAMSAQQRAIAAEDAPKPMSDSTVAGLQELHSAMEAARAEQEASAAPAPEEPKEDEVPKESEEELRQRLDNLDDLEFERRMEAIQQDVINNVKQKKAVEKRLEDGGKQHEMNLEDGLVSGVYEQTVPITDKFNVRYRSISPMENRAMRLLLWKWIDEDPRVENLSSDVYGMMLIVAGVVQIGTNKVPSHLTGSSHQIEFDEAAFKIKYDYMDRYPGPMIHAIGVHANWFDERVRKLFTVDGLKDF